MPSIQLIRLETVHPLLVHFTIGMIPLLLLAYGVAAWRRSESWSFVGDVGASLVAALSCGTLAFGLVSNAVVPWPGGLRTWRYLHMAFGIAAVAGLVGLAVARLAVRRRTKTSGRPTLLVLIATSLAVLFAGWIGGELLVFRSGMAVLAAGEGALAPPAPLAHRSTEVEEVMGAIRGNWATVVTSCAQMLVEHPDEKGFGQVSRATQAVQELARGLQTGGGKPGSFDEMAGLLSERARKTGQAADTRDLASLLRATGDLGSVCAECHATFRWGLTPSRAPSARE